MIAMHDLLSDTLLVFLAAPEIRLGKDFLRAIHAQHGTQVHIFCAHDPDELARCQSAKT